MLKQAIVKSFEKRNHKYVEGVEEEVLTNYIVRETVIHFANTITNLVKVRRLLISIGEEVLAEEDEAIQTMYKSLLKEDAIYGYIEKLNLDLSEVTDYLNKKKKCAVLIISTGGILDSVYEPHKFTTEPSEKTLLPEYLDHLELDYNIEYLHLFAVNSEQMNTERLYELKRVIDESTYDNIIVVHGTATLLNTIEYLNEVLGSIEKKIVVVGSYYPITYSKGDALINIGSVLSSFEYILNGIYAGIKGKVYGKPYNVKIH